MQAIQPTGWEWPSCVLFIIVLFISEEFLPVFLPIWHLQEQWGRGAWVKKHHSSRYRLFICCYCVVYLTETETVYTVKLKIAVRCKYYGVCGGWYFATPIPGNADVKIGD